MFGSGSSTGGRRCDFRWPEPTSGEVGTVRTVAGTLFVLSSSVLFLSLHRDMVRQRERVGSRGGDRESEIEGESETERERCCRREKERCREREMNRERIRSTVGQRWRSRRRHLVLGRRPMAGGAIFDGQNQLPVRQGLSNLSIDLRKGGFARVSSA
jgi:hypothetical protein